MRFDTKIAVVVCDELPTWQRLNVVAFLASGLATAPDVIGEPYEDADGARYLPLFREPVMVFAGPRPKVRRGFDRAASRGATVAVFTADMFETGHDEADRAAVAGVGTADLDVVGF